MAVALVVLKVCTLSFNEGVYIDENVLSLFDFSKSIRCYSFYTVYSYCVIDDSSISFSQTGSTHSHESLYTCQFFT